jgi:stage III sporulation protein SpoIIIAA
MVRAQHADPKRPAAVAASLDDLDALLSRLPPRLSSRLAELDERNELLEIVLDLGRPPEARFPGRDLPLAEAEVTVADLDWVVSKIGEFGDDNRAGIERTLHRISAIRNRRGRIVGLTLRVGRAIFGTIAIIRDLIEKERSILLLGRPGVGKTTMLREMARVLADELGKRVIVVDTSNEIAGDGDVPHPGIGRARRMQVARTDLQHAVMIEAVENHMPEVIIIDEIGTELEAQAARTIAERGVQLIGTAHGNTLENLMLNPTLSDLIGGIQTVTLSDEEARRRGTQKSVLERKAPPTFDAIVEIQTRDRVAVHDQVADVIDTILRGQATAPEIRWLDEAREVQSERRIAPSQTTELAGMFSRPPPPSSELEEDMSGRASRFAGHADRNRPLKVYPYGLSARRLEQALTHDALPIEVTTTLEEASVVIVTRGYHQRKRATLREAERLGIRVCVLKDSTSGQLKRCLSELSGKIPEPPEAIEQAIGEAEAAIERVLTHAEPVPLSPQTSYLRKLQHQLAERHRLTSRSDGEDPERHVTIYP